MKKMRINGYWSIDKTMSGKGEVVIDFNKTLNNILHLAHLCFYNSSFEPDCNNRMKLFKDMLKDDGIIDITTSYNINDKEVKKGELYATVGTVLEEMLKEGKLK